MTSFELLLCIALILISSYLSSSEVALFSLSRFQLRALKERMHTTSYRKIKRLLADPGGLLITILVINEIVNVSLSSLMTEVITRNQGYGFPPSFRQLPPWAVTVFLGTLITTPILLFACEITPKVIGVRANQLIALLTAQPMALIYDIFKPVRFILKKTVFLIARLSSGRFSAERTYDKKDIPTEIGEASKKKSTLLKETDFLLMLEEGHREGTIEQNEFGLIKNVFELDNTTVEDVFTPLSAIQFLPANMDLKNAWITIKTHNFSRIPILSSHKKEVLGILYSKDLLRIKLEANPSSVTVAALMRKPLVVSSRTRLNTLFRKFKRQKTHMAVVQNLKGEALGIVTMTDILKALFEDILPHELETEVEKKYHREENISQNLSNKKSDPIQ